MKQVFLDTVGLVALWDSTDQWHTEAETAMIELIKQPCLTLTSDLVLFECGNAAARRPYREDVNKLRLTLADGGKVISPTSDEIEEAWKAYDRKEAAGAGIVDQVSFILMRRIGITEVLSNDEHFRAAGFATLF